jgi:hypothetical protein
MSIGEPGKHRLPYGRGSVLRLDAAHFAQALFGSLEFSQLGNLVVPKVNQIAHVSPVPKVIIPRSWVL